MEKEPIKGRVRAERVDTKCGAARHMTVDEIKARSIGDKVNVTCPECGQIHLTVEEAEAADKKKLSKTERYAEIKAQAEK
jgi:hypothetical protein